MIAEMLVDYIHRLKKSKRGFFEAWVKFREQSGTNGPHLTTWRRILRQGRASEELAFSILEYMTVLLLDAYESGALIRKEVPIPVSLGEWPRGFKRRGKGGSKAG